MTHQQFLKKFHRDLVIRSLSERTIVAYMQHMRNFLTYFDQHHPADITSDQIRDFMFYQLRLRQYSASYVIGAFSAYKYFYRYTLGLDRDFSGFPMPRRPIRLPVVLSQQEMLNVIDCTLNLKHKTVLMLTYTAGLRIGELLNLKASDIDSERMQIRVRAGKGKKDRYTILSKACLCLLRKYWLEYKPKGWLFNGMKPGSQYSRTSVRKVLKKSMKAANIKKTGVCVHSLRHSFATHLIEQGVDIITVKNLLGHSSLKTTMRYLHVRQAQNLNGRHPFDSFLKSMGQ